jgi:hypothetical protein
MYELSWLLQLSKQEVEMFLLALTPPPPPLPPPRAPSLVSLHYLNICVHSTLGKLIFVQHTLDLYLFDSSSLISN